MSRLEQEEGKKYRQMEKNGKQKQKEEEERQKELKREMYRIEQKWNHVFQHQQISSPSFQF